MLLDDHTFCILLPYPEKDRRIFDLFFDAIRGAEKQSCGAVQPYFDACCDEGDTVAREKQTESCLWVLPRRSTPSVDPRQVSYFKKLSIQPFLFSPLILSNFYHLRDAAEQSCGAIQSYCDACRDKGNEAGIKFGRTNKNPPLADTGQTRRVFRFRYFR